MIRDTEGKNEYFNVTVDEVRVPVIFLGRKCGSRKPYLQRVAIYSDLPGEKNHVLLKYIQLYIRGFLCTYVGIYMYSSDDVEEKKERRVYDTHYSGRLARARCVLNILLYNPKTRFEDCWPNGALLYLCAYGCENDSVLNVKSCGDRPENSSRRTLAVHIYVLRYIRTYTSIESNERAMEFYIHIFLAYVLTHTIFSYNIMDLDAQL